MFQISVDSNRCQGHVRCIAYAPEAFDIDDEGYAQVNAQFSEMGTVDGNMAAAIDNCPERAIVVTDLSAKSSPGLLGRD